MAIYRGSGGSTSTTDQATIDQVAEDAATATTKAAEAATSASSASSSASSATTSKNAAASSASSAASSASTATTKASEASTSASNAATSATNAASSATSASSSATNAASEAAAALSSKASALDAQTAAETAESNASDHADDAVKAAYGAIDTLQTLSDSSTLYSARHYASKTGADKTAAAASATAAAASETAAAASETAAASSETAAANSATAAATSATAAASSATSASGSATTATTKASEAAASETAAAASETAAAASETAAAASESAAATSETNAATSASAASTSASNAASSASSAATSATAAAGSATSASTSASTATTQASNASTSATNAAASETAAAASETAAAASESAAASSASTASTQATNAATSATSAASSASTATTKASEAATSATNAASSASSASSAQTAAEAAKDAALAALDNFDDRYLGVKTSDPTVDNDGNALVTGALYFNSTDDVMKVYDGSAWRAAYADLSGALLATNNLSDLASASTARTNLGLGTAATTASTDYATAAQGALADSALQNITGESIESLSDVATMTPSDGQLLTWDSATSKWNAEDAPVSLPSQTGNSGKYLTTDGSSASWGTVDLSSKLSLSGGTMTGAITFAAGQTFDGRDVSADGSKLDGIEAGATADQTAAEILTAIKTVDGAGSGLDADLLDGQSSAYYQPASTALTTSTTFGGDVSGAYNAIVVANDSHTHDGRYFTETESDARYCLESNNLSDLTSASTARTNLGLGSLATLSSVNASTITDNSVGAAELNVTGNGTTSQFLRSDGDGTFTWATPTDTNTTYSAGSGLSLSGTTFSHTDTSSQASVNNSGATVIQDVTLDTYGHVTGLASKTISYADVGAPSTTGTNASGTWGISITGNAGSVDGYSASTTRNSANTIPVRDGSGYLQLGWINTTSGDTSSTLSRAYVDTGDGYIRKCTLSHLASQMGAAQTYASGCIYENAQTITSNYTMTTNKNGHSAGPITINTGVTVTIPTGSNWVVS